LLRLLVRAASVCLVTRVIQEDVRPRPPDHRLCEALDYISGSERAEHRRAARRDPRAAQRNARDQQRARQGIEGRLIADLTCVPRRFDERVIALAGQPGPEFDVGFLDRRGVVQRRVGVLSGRSRVVWHGANHTAPARTTGAQT